MEFYKTSAAKLTGSGLDEVYPKAFGIFKKIRSQSKRRPYIRSRYFGKQKIFLSIFWQHVHEKSPMDRFRRLRYYTCAIDLLKNTKCLPVIAFKNDQQSDLLYRFGGITAEGSIFYVQVKEDKKSGEKHFISVFPE